MRHPDLARELEAERPEEGAFAVLVVDDDENHRQAVAHILAAPAFRVSEAGNAAEALALIRSSPPFDAILLDYNLPGRNGLDLCREIRALLARAFVPVIMVTARGELDDLVECLHAGACDYLKKPYHPRELEARVRTAARHRRATDHLDSAEAILFTLAEMIEARDGATGDHCARLAHHCEDFAVSLGLDAEKRHALRRGAILHDLGKVAIPDAILLKAGPLTDDEWEIMRRHPVIGAELCSRLHTMQVAVDIIRHHHERWDGSGYPDGLAAEEIPLLARVFQLVDVYDALASERPYKRALRPTEAVHVMREEARKGLLQPTLTDAFLQFLDARHGKAWPEVVGPGTTGPAGLAGAPEPALAAVRCAEGSTAAPGKHAAPARSAGTLSGTVTADRRAAWGATAPCAAGAGDGWEEG